MLRARLRSFVADRSGNIAVMTAVSATVLIGVGAFAVDMGKVFFDRRNAQGIVDLAALTAATSLPNAAALASATVTRNGITPAGPVLVEPGVYVADALVPAAQRFRPSLPGQANAVRVTLATASPLAFGRFLTGEDTISITTTATAATTKLATFAIGSRLLQLDGGILNQLLSAAVGGNVNLSVMDYRALADAKIDLFDFLNAAAVRARLTAGTYESLLATNLKIGDAVGALADVARAVSATSTATRALTQVAGSAVGLQTVALGEVVSLGSQGSLPLGEKPRVGVALSAFDLLSAVARVADGQHQAAAQIDLAIPGIASATVQLTIGERPVESSWIAVGGEGTIVRTAQTRLLLRVRVSAASPLLSLDLPLYVEVAEASATLDTLQCSGAGAPRVALNVRPGVLDAWIGDIRQTQFTDPSRTVSPGPAVIARVAGALEVTARAHVVMDNIKTTSVAFGPTDIANSTVKTVTTTTFLTSLTSGLISDLSIGVSAIGLGLPISLDKTLVTNALKAVAPPLDSAIASILAFLGVGIGQADVWVSGIRCDGAVLVN